jgi:mRNA interferase MazF
MILRGEVYSARPDPTDGSEQAGSWPVVIVSRNAINAHSRIVQAVPCTTYHGQRIYPSQTLLHTPDGGLIEDSIAMGEQVRVLSHSRLLRRLGMLSATAIADIDQALLIAFDLLSVTAGDG